MRQIPGIHTRPATPGDAAAIAEIYNQGIAERIATFETEPRAPAQMAAWLKPGNLVEAARSAGLNKLTSRAFPENVASPALLKRLGFEEIGIHRRHGKLDGIWRDCVIVERLLGDQDNGAHE